jgi:tRNA A37 threonylcarbamoyladenosine synthetase subunit TsaC/SUA5/YrdC
LVAELGSPIISTSANHSAEDVISDPEMLLAEFGHGVDLVVDAGQLPVQPSTVISLLNDEVVILREGGGDLDYFRAQVRE